MGSKLKGTGVEFPDGTLQTTASVGNLKLNGKYKKEPMNATFQPSYSTGIRVESPNRGIEIPENMEYSYNDNSIINGKHYYQWEVDITNPTGTTSTMDLVFNLGWPNKPIKAIKITAELSEDVSDYMFFLYGSNVSYSKSLTGPSGGTGMSHPDISNLLALSEESTLIASLTTNQGEVDEHPTVYLKDVNRTQATEPIPEDFKLIAEPLYQQGTGASFVKGVNTEDWLGGDYHYLQFYYDGDLVLNGYNDPYWSGNDYAWQNSPTYVNQTVKGDDGYYYQIGPLVSTSDIPWTTSPNTVAGNLGQNDLKPGNPDDYFKIRRLANDIHSPTHEFLLVDTPIPNVYEFTWVFDEPITSSSVAVTGDDSSFDDDSPDRFIQVIARPLRPGDALNPTFGSIDGTIFKVYDVTFHEELSDNKDYIVTYNDGDVELKEFDSSIGDRIEKLEKREIKDILIYPYYGWHSPTNLTTYDIRSKGTNYWAGSATSWQDIMDGINSAYPPNLYDVGKRLLFKPHVYYNNQIGSSEYMIEYVWLLTVRPAGYTYSTFNSDGTVNATYTPSAKFWHVEYNGLPRQLDGNQEIDWYTYDGTW